jgi:hypothetical protein
LALVESSSMPSRPGGRVLAVLAAVLIPLGALTLGASAVAAAPTATSAAVAHITGTPPTTTPLDATDNPFVPPDKNLSDCVSANPEPGCGSKAHGGWRQFLTFVLVALAMAFIGWRIVRGVRANRKQLESSGRR